MFKAMSPIVVRNLIEGQADVLSEELQRETAYFRSINCPICYKSGGCEKRLRVPKIVTGPDGYPEVTNSPFDSDRNLPQGIAHCIHCGTDFDPGSSVIIHTEASSLQPVDLDPATRIVSPPQDPHLR
jgi:hypothetical protein